MISSSADVTGYGKCRVKGHTGDFLLTLNRGIQRECRGCMGLRGEGRGGGCRGAGVNGAVLGRAVTDSLVVNWKLELIWLILAGSI